ncbi:hypothetical protein MEQU1_000327 [Malassezia equina]|uniref:Uncharacterized protein n=1 Tax=Malassezia equina TaxID=1381935 RepID=A0AAF0EB32_9BASI|nr:hypothetical protein MEQU1_000327 [Malassezia equina]
MRRFLARARAPPPSAAPDYSVGLGEEHVRKEDSYPSYAEERHTPPQPTSWHREAKGDGLPLLLPSGITKKGDSDDTTGPSAHRKRRPPFSFRRRANTVDFGADLRHLELGGAAATPVSRSASVEAVPSYIAEFCSAAPTDDDWECVYELGELVNQSPAHSKAALRALLHELKVPYVAAQCRAVRTWGVWSMHEGRHFSDVATHSHLLAQLEEILMNPLTYPPLRSDTLLVVGALASRSRQNDRLHKIARLWARTRPRTSPEHGVPLSAPLFQGGSMPEAATDDAASHPQVPTMDVRTSPTPLPSLDPIPPRPMRVPDSLSPGRAPIDRPAPPTLTPSHSSHGSHSHELLYSDWDDVRAASLEQECLIAKTNAALLTELLLSGEDDETLLDEIRAKIHGAQSELEPQLLWASERTSSLHGEALYHAEELLHSMVSALSSAGEALALCHQQGDTTVAQEEPADVHASPDTLEEAPWTKPSAKALGKRRALDEPADQVSLPYA